jgi:hypothetical protein
MIDFLDRNETLAYALGIPLYIDDAGHVWQHDGPGRRRIDPKDGAKPLMLGAPHGFTKVEAPSD